MKHWFVLIVLVVFLAAAGCGQGSDLDLPGDNGNGETDDTNGIDDTGDKNTDGTSPDSPLEGEYFAVASIMDLSSNFKEIRCIFVEQAVEYFFLGQDTVDGVKAEHIKIKLQNDKYEVWVDIDSKPVRTLRNGEEMPPEMGVGIIALIQALDTFIKDQGYNERWRDAEVKVETRDLGAGPVKVTTFDWKRPPMPYYVEVEVAEIAGRNLIIAMWLMTNDGASMPGGWRIDRVIPR